MLKQNTLLVQHDMTVEYLCVIILSLTW